MGLLTQAAKDALGSGIVHLAVLVELDFTTGVERYWSGLYELSWDSVTWLPTGNMGSVSPIESSEDLHANGMTLTLNGLPGDALRNVRRLTPDQYKGRPGRFILAVFDANFQTVIHAIPRHFKIDGANYAYDPEAGGAVSIQLENEIKHASRTRERRYTDQSQQGSIRATRHLSSSPTSIPASK